MISTLVDSLGLWSWWLLGLLLLVAELILPGIFMVWIGIAALAVGLLSLGLWSTPVWTWQVQVVVFALLSLISAMAGRHYFARQHPVSDEPFLNQPTGQLVGRTAVLFEAIVNGRGKVRLGDTVWPVEGPDLAEGETVRIVSANGARLQVEKA